MATPRYLTFTNTTRNTVLGTQIRLANNTFTRVVGLLNRKSIAPSEGLWITPCDSIHMWGMRFAIDVLFIDKNLRAVHLVHNIPPGKMVWPIKGAYSVVELPPGTLKQCQCEIGDQFTQAITPKP